MISIEVLKNEEGKTLIIKAKGAPSYTIETSDPENSDMIAQLFERAAALLRDNALPEHEIQNKFMQKLRLLRNE
jgi:hypothetical protein